MLTAVSPLAPLSISKFTLLPSAISAGAEVMWKKRLSPFFKFLIKPYPFEELKCSTMPSRGASTISSCLETEMANYSTLTSPTFVS